MHLLHSLAAVGGVVLTFVGLFFGTKARIATVKVEPAPAAIEPLQPAPASPSDGLTAEVCMELVGHEAIVLEAYKDSQGIWTWGIGVTDASGHKVERYIDNPQPIATCLVIFIWLLRARYLPAVKQVFAGHELTDEQLAAALSFHYNTGAIGHASWVTRWKAGQIDEARKEFMIWDKPPSIVDRRQKECDLFFDGTWSNDGKAYVIPVLKPSYRPDFRNEHRVDIMPDLKGLLG